MSKVQVRGVNKRNKPSLSCTNCRKRKVKCNRNQPCLSCTAKNLNCSYDKVLQPLVFNDCIYSSRVHKETLILQNASGRILSLKNKQKDEYNAEDSLDLHKGYRSVHIKEPFLRVNIGALSWLSIFNKDPWLSHLWDFSNEKGDITIFNKSIPQINNNDSQMFRINDSDEKKDGVISEKIFHRRVLEQEGYEEKAPFKMFNNLEPEEFLERTKNLNSTSRAFVKALFEGKFETELHLFEKIKAVLPGKRTLWSLVHIYFTTVYPFMPYLDQDDFTKNLISILGPYNISEDPITQISIRKKLDLAIVAQLLIIIRFSYLSLLSDRESVINHYTKNPPPSELKFDINYLLSTPINLTTIDVAKSCMESFDIKKKPTISLLQSHILMRVYHQLAPEFGDGVDGGYSVISSALLVQVAVSLGINREPDDFIDSATDERRNHLTRKIWAGVVEISYLNSIFSGLPFTVNIKNSDVKTPFCNKINSNIYDADVESEIIEEYTWIPGMIPLDNYLNMILDIRGPLLINEFTPEVSKIENLCMKKLFTIKEKDRKFGIFQEVKRAQLFLQIRSSMITIYFHLFLHYEKLQLAEKAFYYLKKNFLILLEELIPFYLEVKVGRFRQYGFYLIPFIETCFHKANHLILSTYMRVTYLKQTIQCKLNNLNPIPNESNYNSQYNYLLSLEESLFKVGTTIVKVFSDLSVKYFYSWRIAKSHKLFLKFVREREFYEDLKLPIISLSLKIVQLDYLNGIAQSILDQFSKANSVMDSRERINDTTVQNKNEISNEESNTDLVVDDMWLLWPFQLSDNNIFESNIYENMSDIIGLFDINVDNYDYLKNK